MQAETEKMPEAINVGSKSTIFFTQMAVHSMRGIISVALTKKLRKLLTIVSTLLGSFSSIKVKILV